MPENNPAYARCQCSIAAWKSKSRYAALPKPSSTSASGRDARCSPRRAGSARWPRRPHATPSELVRLLSSSRAGRESTPKNLLSPDEESAGRPDRVKRCMGTRHMAVTASDKGVAEPSSYRRTRVRSFVRDFGQECSPRGAGCGPMLDHGVFQTTDHAPLTLKPRRRSTVARGRVRPSERARARRGRPGVRQRPAPRDRRVATVRCARGSGRSRWPRRRCPARRRSVRAATVPRTCIRAQLAGLSGRVLGGHNRLRSRSSSRVAST